MRTLLFIALICFTVFAAQHWGGAKDDKSIDSPAWIPLCVLADSISVSWIDEFGMQTHAACVGVWRSASHGEYMLTQKNSARIILEASQITGLSWEPIRKVRP